MDRSSRHPGAGPAGFRPLSRRSLVLGGGLAGLAAAVRLADAGVAVTLVEGSGRLGGRATSHRDPVSGELIDNCQHVLLGCCTNLLDFYQRLGVAETIEWHRCLYFVDRSGCESRLEAVDLPAPLHLAPALWRLGTLAPADKLAISRGMWAILRMSPAERVDTGHMSFGDWLQQHHQPPAAIDRFWDLVIVSALNQRAESACCAHALQVFAQGFLSHPRAYQVGVPRCPLRHLYDPAVERIEARGGQVRLGVHVDRLAYDGAGISAVHTSDGELLEAGHYISALPFDRLASVADRDLAAADPRLAGLDRFECSPILGVHLWFDRPVMQRPHAVLVDSPLQWVFNKGPAPGGDPGGQYLHVVVSAADRWMPCDGSQIVSDVVSELRHYLSAVRAARLVRGQAIKERRATFASRPGIDAIRPEARGPVANLLLAGDWCRTGWPATMEGAVRSGYLAAAAIAGDERPALAAELPTSEICRWVGGRKAAGR